MEIKYMSSNIEAFASFRSQLTGQQQLSNGDETFIGQITYNFKGQSLKETLKVTMRLTTNEYGQISIKDGVILFGGKVHMDFIPKFVKYSLNDEGFLIIKGKSGQIGNYEVKIIQN